MKNDDVHTIADAYLKQLTRQTDMKTVTVLHESTRLKTRSPYIEDVKDFVNRMKKENAEYYEAQRYETSDVPTRFVLKSGHKYFYALKNGEIKWTYDIKLAYVEHTFAVEGLIHLLELYGAAEVTVLPAPEKDKF